MSNEELHKLEPHKNLKCVRSYHETILNIEGYIIACIDPKACKNYRKKTHY